MAKFAECLCLDLTNTLTSDVEFSADFFECSGVRIVKTVSQTKHFFFTRSERIEHLNELFFEHIAFSNLTRRLRGVVLYEVAKMAVLFLADRRFEGYGVLRDF